MQLVYHWFLQILLILFFASVGNSKDVVRFSYPFFSLLNLDATSDLAGVVSSTTTIIFPPQYETPWFHIFNSNSSVYKVFSVAEYFLELNHSLAVGGGCIDKSEENFFFYSSPSFYQLGLLDGSIEVLYTDPNASVFLESVEMYCATDGLLTLADEGIYWISYASGSASIFPWQQESYESVWSWTVLPDQKKLLAATAPRSNSTITYLLFDLSSSNGNLTLLYNGTFGDDESNLELTSCAFSLADNRTVSLLQRSNNTLKAILIDTESPKNVTSQNLLPYPWDETYSALIQCASFPEGVSVFNSFYYGRIQQISVVSLATTSDLSATTHTWYRNDTANPFGPFLGWRSPSVFQSTSCTIDIDAVLCRLYTYTISNGSDSNVSLSFVSSVASSPYNMVGTLFTDSSIAYAVSIQQYNGVYEDQPYFLDVLELNLTSSSPQPRRSVTVQLSFCDCVSDSYNFAYTFSQIISVFAFQTNDTILIWTACSDILLVDLPTFGVKFAPLDQNCFLSCTLTTELLLSPTGLIYALNNDVFALSGNLTLKLISPQAGTYVCESPSVFVATQVSTPSMLLNDSNLFLIGSELFGIYDGFTLEQQFLRIDHTNDSRQLAYQSFLSDDRTEAYLISFGVWRYEGQSFEFEVYNLTSHEKIIDVPFVQEYFLPPPNFPAMILQDQTIYILMEQTGHFFQLNLSGVITDSIQVAPPSSELHYSGIIPDSDGAIYLAVGQALTLVYATCPPGFYREIVNGACLPCTSNSISSPVNQQLCSGCPIHTAPDATRTVCLCSEFYFSSQNLLTDCQPCPAGAVCSGNNSIAAKAGFWAGYDGTFYACPYAAVACNGSGCTEGYAGPVCALCDKGYGKTPLGCTKCHRYQWLYTIPILFLVLILLCVLFALLWKDTNDGNEQFFGIFKTVLSFVQVLGFPSGRLPFFAMPRLQHFYSRFVGVYSMIGLRVFSVASVDCLFGKHIASYYAELLLIGFVPILLSGGILMWWYFTNEKQRRETLAKLSSSSSSAEELHTPYREEKDNHQRELFTGMDPKFSAPLRLLLFVFLLIHPYMSTLLVQFFECQKIDSVYYLIADYASRCFDSKWKRMLGVEVVLALLYPLAGPVAIFLLLRHKRDKVNVRFMTAQYKPAYYFWDVVELYRKFILLAAAILDQFEQQTHPQWMSGLPLTISVTSLVFYTALRPHRQKLERAIHTGSLVGVCLLYALPFISVSNTSHNYHLMISWIVMIYLTTFTSMSTCIAIWTARHDILVKMPNCISKIFASPLRSPSKDKSDEDQSSEERRRLLQ